MITFFHVIFCVLCTVILLQDMIGVFLFNEGIGNPILQLFLASKDILLFMIIALNLITCAVKKIQVALNSTISFFAAYFVIVLCYFLMQDNRVAVTNDFRSLVFPVYAYFAGYTSFYLKEEKMIKCVSIVAFLSVVCSLLFYMGGPAFFIKIGTLSYTELVKQYYGLTFNNLPSTFFSYFGHTAIFRLAGPVLNPIGTATLYTFVAGLFIGYYRFVKKDQQVRVLLTITILAIFLTFSRGPIIGLVAGLFLTNLSGFRKKNTKKSMLVIYSVIAVLFIIFYKSFFSMLRETLALHDTSTRSHYNAILSSVEYLKYNWMGRGIGSVGMWRGTDYTGGAGENSFVFIIGQVGIFAFIFLAGAYFSVIKKLIQHKNNYLNYGLLICIIAVLFNSFFAPSLLTVTPLILFWFFVGYSQRSEALKSIMYKERAGKTCV